MTGSYQIKNGRYYAVLNIKNEFGKIKPKWIAMKLPVKGTPKKVVKERFEALKHEYAYLDTTLENKILFSDYIKVWLSSYESKQVVDEVTLQGYRQTVFKHLLPYFEDIKIKLKDITPAMIEKYYADKMKSGRCDGKGGLSAKSIRQHHAVISNVFKMAYRNNIISVNPIEKVELPKLERFTGKAYTPEEIKSLLSVIQEDKIYPLILTTIIYGLRLSEVTALKWDAVDFKRNTVEIKRTAVKVSTMVLKEKTKNESSHRIYPLTPEIKKLFIEQLNKQNKTKELLKSGYIDEGFVFTNENGSQMLPQSTSRRFKRLLKRYDFPDIRFHDLRHSCASLLINQGAELKDIADWLGHSDIKMTANLYGHIYDEHKKELSKNFNILFQ